MPYRSPTSLSRVGEMSQPATTSKRSGMASSTGRWTTWATSPSPMIPVRSLVMCRSFAVLDANRFTDRRAVIARQSRAGADVEAVNSVEEQVGEAFYVHVDGDAAVGLTGLARGEQV